MNEEEREREEKKDRTNKEKDSSETNKLIQKKNNEIKLIRKRGKAKYRPVEKEKDKKSKSLFVMAL